MKYYYRQASIAPYSRQTYLRAGQIGCEEVHEILHRAVDVSEVDVVQIHRAGG